MDRDPAPTEPPNILVVDDAPASLTLLAGLLREEGCRVRPVTSGQLALEAAAAERPDLILLDVTMPGLDGYETCRQLKARADLRDVPVLFISSLAEVADKVKGFETGGVDYVTKPFQADEVRARVRTHLTLRRLQLDLQRRYDELKRVTEEKLYFEDEIRTQQGFGDIIGQSPAMTAVFQQIDAAAPTDATVLLLGETGTGKELLARAVHEHSPRKARTFVRVNAAALPATLLESELFGYERGAFTGAQASKMGRLELAHQGTLFLDEVGDIPLDVQPKLLRALQEREFERLGSTRTTRVDVRLVAATNLDLASMVEQGKFRSDLFYRLNVFPVRVPALRDRRGDIPLLVRHFLQKLGPRFKRPMLRVSDATMTMLQEWPWPGNIRELENVIERAVILSPGDLLQVPRFGTKTGPDPRASSSASSAARSFQDGQRELILRALRETNGVIAGPDGAAARLGLRRTTLQSKMRKLGITRPRF